MASKEIGLISEEDYRHSLHTPSHLFRPHAIYMVTGATYKKRPLLNSDRKKEHFLKNLFERLGAAGWELAAWAVLPNHYHIVAQAPEDSSKLKSIIRAVHSISAKLINSVDKMPGRRVWYNYWDTCITHEGSYLARLHYVHTNPLRHGVVAKAEDYPFCSYHWFMTRANAEFCKRVFSQPIEGVDVRDDFD
jgi:putative transposase